MAFTPMDDSEAREGTIVSNDFFTQLATNIAYLLKNMPVGTVIPILSGFPSIPEPNPNLWQLCDGSLITNPNSPLINKNTPVLTADRYLIKAGFGGDIGTIGGFNIISDFGHDHFSYTEFSTQNPSQQYEEDNFAFNTKAHQHLIPPSLSGATDVTPRNITIKHYIKIL